MQWSARSQARLRSCRLASTAPPWRAWSASKREQQALVRRVEMRRRLVEQQQRRFLQQRGRDRDPLPLAAGKRPHVDVGQAVEVEPTQQPVDGGAVAPNRSAARHQQAAIAGQHRGLAHRRRKRVRPELRAPGAPSGERVRATMRRARRPSIRTCPAASGKTPAIAASSDDLPAPFGPMTTQRWPLPMRRSSAPNRSRPRAEPAGVQLQADDLEIDARAMRSAVDALTRLASSPADAAAWR